MPRCGRTGSRRPNVSLRTDAGFRILRQKCSGPSACRSLRVDAVGFRANRSQRRTHNANAEAVRLRIGTPAVAPEKVALFERFQADRSETRGWSPYDSDNLAEFARSFVLNPFPTQGWCYFLEDVLIGVGYADELAGGLSAIYFARDPAYRDRSLGTWNVLCLLNRARALGLPYVYLGYHVDGCPSLQYKARFRPNERLDPMESGVTAGSENENDKRRNVKGGRRRRARPIEGVRSWHDCSTLGLLLDSRLGLQYTLTHASFVAVGAYDEDPPRVDHAPGHDSRPLHGDAGRPGARADC